MIARYLNTHHQEDQEPIQILTQEARRKREGTQKRDSLRRRNHSLPKSLTSKVAVLMLIPLLRNLKKVRKTKRIPQITHKNKLNQMSHGF